MTETWWLDAVKNPGAGGMLKHAKYADFVTSVDLSNTQYWVGFVCQAGLSSAPYNYESESVDSFIHFDLPSGIGVPISAILYLRAFEGNYLSEGSWKGDINVNVYYKDIVDYASSAFPVASLDSQDNPLEQWVWEGSIATSMQDIIDEVSNTGYANPTWYLVDVTNAVINSPVVQVSFRIRASQDAPTGWSYTSRPYNYNEYFRLAFVGALGSRIQEPPPGFPLNVDQHANPWLQIVYDTPSGGSPPPPQPEPGEIVTSGYQSQNSVLCVAADSKARVAIAGTAHGSLYMSRSGSSDWKKIYEI
jgi:hypothetical protein